MANLLSTLVPLVLLAAEPSVGPKAGALVIHGGNRVEPATVSRFIELAGGPAAEVVLVPTATEADEFDTQKAGEAFRKAFGLANVTVLHTRDRGVADSEAFVAPLKTARGVWFSGGRQWRLVDSYLGTRTQRELEAVLARGGVIGGTSAGATIQGSYLVRGAREGNHIMMAPGYEQGFGYLRGVAIDQHLLARHREADMVAVIQAHPQLLGLGIDESTAVVVQGDLCEIIGKSKVAIYDGKQHDGKLYYFLSAGDRFDLKSRERQPPAAVIDEVRCSPAPARP